MTWQSIVSAVCLTIGVGAGLLASLGVLVMSNVYARLHYVGLATVVGTVAIAAAVLFTEGLSMAGLKVILIALVLLSTGPVLTHATARAARVRQFGDWRARPDEPIEKEVL